MLLLSFLNPPSSATGPQAFHLNGKAQGTTYHITFYADEPVNVENEVNDIFQQIDQSLSIYQPGTLINAFNQAERSSYADRHLKAVVAKSISIYRQSAGRFDITLHPVIELWGFGTRSIQQFPDSAEVQRAMRRVGSDKLKIRGKKLIKKDPAVKINVNAIAPGYTSDLIARRLEALGIKTYVVDVGGELRIKGRKPDGSLLRVGIEAPSGRPIAGQASPSVLQRIITVEDGAITTSGNYRQYLEKGGQKVSHLIDGRTGFPLENELISVTVFAKDAMTADGFDNVLMAMGLQESFRFLKKKKDMEAYFIYKNKEGQICDTATKGFYKLFVN